MIVLCCGMVRSASTWSFNVCLELLRASGRTAGGFHSPSLEATLASLPEALDAVVFKSHELDPFCLDCLAAGRAVAVYTHRDPVDAVASAMNIFHLRFEEALKLLIGSLQTMRLLREAQTGLFLSYDCIRDATAAQVQLIAAHIGAPVGPAQVADIAGRTGFEKLKWISDHFEELTPDRIVDRQDNWAYDRVTLLHRNHIQDGRSGRGRMQLSELEQRRVLETCREFETEFVLSR